MDFFCWFFVVGGGVFFGFVCLLVFVLELRFGRGGEN